MRWILMLAAAVVLAPVAAEAQSFYTRPHMRRDGTYVPESYRGRPDSGRFDSDSARGNAHPHHGRRGSAEPFRPRRR